MNKKTGGHIRNMSNNFNNGSDNIFGRQSTNNSYIDKSKFQ